MSDIVAQVRQLGWPLDQVVVIGSGLLDAWGLRPSDDVDVVVAPELFEILRRARDDLRYEDRGGYGALIRDNLEVFLDWGDELPYEVLRQDAIQIDGVWFMNPAQLIARKKVMGRDKDLQDVALLEEFLRGRQ